MTSMSQDIKNFKKHFGYFLIEFLSHYPDIDISHWLRENYQWIMDKVFREKLMV